MKRGLLLWLCRMRAALVSGNKRNYFRKYEFVIRYKTSICTRSTAAWTFYKMFSPQIGYRSACHWRNLQNQGNSLILWIPKSKNEHPYVGVLCPCACECECFTVYVYKFVYMSLRLRVSMRLWIECICASVCVSQCPHVLCCVLQLCPCVNECLSTCTCM